MKYCTNCGKMIDVSANACPYCGFMQKAAAVGGYRGTAGGKTLQKNGISVFDFLTIAGFLFVLISMFLPLRGFNSNMPEYTLNEYVSKGAKVNATMLNANLAIGIVTLVVVVCGLAAGLYDCFVNRMGRLVILIGSVAAAWTFIALWIARAAAPRKVVSSLAVAEFGPGYDLVHTDGYEQRIQEALSSESFWEYISTKVGFWFLLIGIMIVVAGIVMKVLTNQGKEQKRYRYVQ